MANGETPLALKEVAHRFGKTSRWMTELANSGRLGRFVFRTTPTGRWMILPSDVEKLLESLRAGGAK